MVQHCLQIITIASTYAAGSLINREIIRVIIVTSGLNKREKKMSDTQDEEGDDLTLFCCFTKCRERLTHL